MNAWFEYVVPSIILSDPKTAHPFDPLPPLPISPPGTPDPAY